MTMYRILMALAALLASSAAVHADALDDAQAARDLAISSLARLDAVAEPSDDPVALAEQLRLEVHVPLLSYYADMRRYADYDAADVKSLTACLMMLPVEVDRFSNEVEYALKLGKPLPEMVNRAAYDAALESCDAALLAAAKP